MGNDYKINWLDVVSIEEFQCYLNFNLIKEVSMVSTLMREKLKPVLFKNLLLKLERIKFESNPICAAYENRNINRNYDYKSLKEENRSGVEDSLDDFINALDEIKRYCRGFYLDYSFKSGYYLYSLINYFKNLSELKILYCDIPYRAFTDIGKTLPNLNRLEIQSVNLVKSPTDKISEIDITFPSNLAYLKLYSIRVITTTFLSDPYEYLFNNKVSNYSHEDFILPRISIPTLKRLDIRLLGQPNHRLEDFIEVNRNLESLLTRRYNLNIINSLISLKCLDVDEYTIFNSIDQLPRFNSINNLTFSIANFTYCDKIKKMCNLFPNLYELNLHYNGRKGDFQALIDYILTPALPNLLKLKTLRLINIPNVNDPKVLDFSNFTQIEKLEITMWSLTPNINFNNCKSLKQVKFESAYCNVVRQLEFREEFNKYKSWKFKFDSYIVKGYKI